MTTSDIPTDVSADVRRVAEDFYAHFREVVVMLRRLNTDMPVTGQQLAVLGSLESGPCRMSQLADEHGVRLPTMTAQIRRLVRDGLVVRGTESGDGRVVTVRLTPLGMERLQAGRERRVAFLAERLTSLSATEQEAMATALPALRKLVS